MADDSIPKADAERLITDYKTYLGDDKQPKLDTTSCYISIDELNQIIANDAANGEDNNCTGIRLYLGKTTFDSGTPGAYEGLQLVYARTSKNDPSGMNNTFKSTIPPCPKNCPS